MDWIRAPRTYSELSATASHPLTGLRQGGKIVEERHRVVRRAGAVVEAACSISANPYYSVQRFYRVSEARDAPDRDRSGSLVSNTAFSSEGIELSQLGADAGLGPPARLVIPPTYPNSGIFPLTGCPGRYGRRQTRRCARCRQ